MLAALAVAVVVVRSAAAAACLRSAAAKTASRVDPSGPVTAAVVVVGTEDDAELSTVDWPAGAVVTFSAGVPFRGKPASPVNGKAPYAMLAYLS